MNDFTEVNGNIVTLAEEGHFDVVVHGCNCFCVMGAGLAPQMARAFGADKFALEQPRFKGVINKLGMIDYEYRDVPGRKLAVVNAYTQYGFGRNHANGTESPVDYEAIQMAFRKMNHIFKGKTIGVPQIGCGLAGGSWSIVRKLIHAELADMKVVIVNYVQ